MDSSSKAGPSSGNQRVLRQSTSSKAAKAKSTPAKPTAAKKAKKTGGRKQTNAKRTSAGDGEKSTSNKMKFLQMWLHYDQLLQDATKEEMIHLNARFMDVITEFQQEKNQ